MIFNKKKVLRVARILSMVVSGGILISGFQNCARVQVQDLSSELSKSVSAQNAADPSGTSSVGNAVDPNVSGTGSTSGTSGSSGSSGSNTASGTSSGSSGESSGTGSFTPDPMSTPTPTPAPVVSNPVPTPTPVVNNPVPTPAPTPVASNPAPSPTPVAQNPQPGMCSANVDCPTGNICSAGKCVASAGSTASGGDDDDDKDSDADKLCQGDYKLVRVYNVNGLGLIRKLLRGKLFPNVRSNELDKIEVLALDAELVKFELALQKAGKDFLMDLSDMHNCHHKSPNHDERLKRFTVIVGRVCGNLDLTFNERHSHKHKHHHHHDHDNDDHHSCNHKDHDNDDDHDQEHHH